MGRTSTSNAINADGCIGYRFHRKDRQAEKRTRAIRISRRYPCGSFSFFSMDFYHSKKWEHMRKSILRRDEYKCKWCRRYGKNTEASHVHHILPYEYYPEYSMERWNLISLCQSCHNKMHDRDTHELSAEGERLARSVARGRGIPWMR